MDVFGQAAQGASGPVFVLHAHIPYMLFSSYFHNGSAVVYQHSKMSGITWATLRSVWTIPHVGMCLHTCPWTYYAGTCVTGC